MFTRSVKLILSSKEIVFHNQSSVFELSFVPYQEYPENLLPAWKTSSPKRSLAKALVPEKHPVAPTQLSQGALHILQMSKLGFSRHGRHMVQSSQPARAAQSPKRQSEHPAQCWQFLQCLLSQFGAFGLLTHAAQGEQSLHFCLHSWQGSYSRLIMFQCFGKHPFEGAHFAQSAHCSHPFNFGFLAQGRQLAHLSHSEYLSQVPEKQAIQPVHGLHTSHFSHPSLVGSSMHGRQAAHSLHPSH